MAATKKKEKKNAMAVINQNIKSGEFAKIYLLYGKERYLVINTGISFLAHLRIKMII